ISSVTTSPYRFILVRISLCRISFCCTAMLRGCRVRLVDPLTTTRSMGLRATSNAPLHMANSIGRCTIPRAWDLLLGDKLSWCNHNSTGLGCTPLIGLAAFTGTMLHWRASVSRHWRRHASNAVAGPFAVELDEDK